MSLVPDNVNELYAQAVNDALQNGGNFERECVASYFTMRNPCH
jgi:hypothetical protein